LVLNSFFVGKDSFFAVLISAVVQGETQENVATGGDAFEQHMNHVSPRIDLKNPYVLKEGEIVALQEIFSAITEENSLIPVSMLGCWNADGIEGEIGYIDEEYICASNPGIYWMNIYAVDDNGRDRDVLLKVFVNER